MAATEEPIETEGSRGTTITHPAFGAIQASRVSGGNVSLHGSDFVHNHFIALRIHTASMKRNLSSDWYHPDQELIEVYMSEAQWASFVSSLNMGAGVPYTLQHVQRQPIPQLPRPKQTSAAFEREMREHLDGIATRLQALMLGAKTVAQRQEIAGLLTEVKSNVPFVAEQFGKHVEKTIHRAKMEVNAYITSQAMGSEQLLPPMTDLPVIEMSDDLSDAPGNPAPEPGETDEPE